MASASERKPGMYRPLAAISATRDCAAGETSAIHRPPSEPKHFCGPK